MPFETVALLANLIGAESIDPPVDYHGLRGDVAVLFAV